MSHKAFYLLIIILLTSNHPTIANDPPMPPEIHEVDDDRIPGGGAPLDDHWVLWALIGVGYVALRLFQQPPAPRTANLGSSNDNSENLKSQN